MSIAFSGTLGILCKRNVTLDGLICSNDMVMCGFCFPFTLLRKNPRSYPEIISKFICLDVVDSLNSAL